MTFKRKLVTTIEGDSASEIIHELIEQNAMFEFKKCRKKKGKDVVEIYSLE